MRTAGMIDVTGVPLEALVRAAYSPSRQQGLGVFDVSGQQDGLTDAEVKDIIDRDADHHLNAVTIDYLRGRSVKFTVRKKDGRHYIQNCWCDHSDYALRTLLEHVGLSGDLVDKARAEESEYKARVKAMAIDFLKEHGGSFRENRGLRTNPSPDEQLPEDVQEGLWVAIGDNLVTSDYEDSGYSVWKLVA